MNDLEIALSLIVYAVGFLWARDMARWRAGR